jgi:hypothetical protein
MGKPNFPEGKFALRKHCFLLYFARIPPFSHMELLLPSFGFGDDDDDDVYGNDRDDGFSLDDDTLDFDDEGGEEDDDEKNPLGIEGIGEDY